MSDCPLCDGSGICGSGKGEGSTRWACPVCADRAEIARLRAEVERLKVLADGCPDSQNEDACGDCLNCLRFGMRAALDSRALALAEVERMTKERDEAAVYLRCAKCIRQGRTDATTHCVECSGDLIWKEPEHDLSDLVGCMPSFPIGSQEIGGYLRGTSTAEDAIQKTTLRTRAESAEARVAELEAALRPFADACRPGGFGSAVSMHHWQRARALLSPKPAPNGETLTPEESAEIRKRHAASPGIDRVRDLVAANIERFEARAKRLPIGDCGETPAPCGKCGGSGQRPCPYLEAECKRRGHNLKHTDCPDCRGGRMK